MDSHLSAFTSGFVSLNSLLCLPGVQAYLHSDANRAIKIWSPEETGLCSLVDLSLLESEG